MEGFARLTDETPDSVRRPERHAFRLLGDCREGQHCPVVLRQYVADQVVLMQTLHDDDDAAGAFVVEAGEKRAGASPCRRRRRLVFDDLPDAVVLKVLDELSA
jgi:hypothetical protein